MHVSRTSLGKSKWGGRLYGGRRAFQISLASRSKTVDPLECHQQRLKLHHAHEEFDSIGRVYRPICGLRAACT